MSGLSRLALEFSAILPIAFPFAFLLDILFDAFFGLLYRSFNDSRLLLDASKSFCASSRVRFISVPDFLSSFSDSPLFFLSLSTALSPLSAKGLCDAAACSAECSAASPSLSGRLVANCAFSISWSCHLMACTSTLIYANYSGETLTPTQRQLLPRTRRVRRAQCRACKRHPGRNARFATRHLALSSPRGCLRAALVPGDVLAALQLTGASPRVPLGCSRVKLHFIPYNVPRTASLLVSCGHIYFNRPNDHAVTGNPPRRLGDNSNKIQIALTQNIDPISPRSLYKARRVFQLRKRCSVRTGG
ncbi:hypothetical protein PUN28_017539 [Cardiocondyla obscurior]|uniref:Uncharacterized protein n=1 Tax=Cardiocondyla obscurior TaxID=286306 RepID=A0AAW2ELS4_9HYME